MNILTSSSVARFLSICISYNFSMAGSVVKLFRIIASVTSCKNLTYCNRSRLCSIR
jgi:hypothetical protein